MDEELPVLYRISKNGIAADGRTRSDGDNGDSQRGNGVYLRSYHQKLVLGRNQNAGFINDVPGNAEKGCGDVPKRAVGSSSKKYQLYGRSGIVLSRIPFGDAWKYERVYRKIKPGKEKQAAGHCRTSSRCRTGSGNSGIKDFRYVHTQNPPHTDCVSLGKGWGCRIKKFSYRILLLTENENAISCMPFSCCDSPITTLLCKDNIPTHDT